jgi:hypothetical protein
VGRGDKIEVQTCEIDESCQSHDLHEIHNFSNSYLREETESSMQALRKLTTARLDALNISVRLMKWPNSGMSNTSWLKNRMVMWLSKGVSIRDTTTSKYSLSPLKRSEVRAGRETHVIGRGCRFALSAGDRGDRN